MGSILLGSSSESLAFSWAPHVESNSSKFSDALLFLCPRAHFVLRNRMHLKDTSACLVVVGKKTRSPRTPHPAACAAPMVYGRPYVVPAPVYTMPAPVYAAPAYPSIGYYQPPRSVVVEEKSVSRPPADPPNNTLAKAESKLAGLGYGSYVVERGYWRRCLSKMV
jgi:hypothetical protein